MTQSLFIFRENWNYCHCYCSTPGHEYCWTPLLYLAICALLYHRVHRQRQVHVVDATSTPPADDSLRTGDTDSTGPQLNTTSFIDHNHQPQPQTVPAQASTLQEQQSYSLL